MWVIYVYFLVSGPSLLQDLLASQGPEENSWTHFHSLHDDVIRLNLLTHLIVVEASEQCVGVACCRDSFHCVRPSEHPSAHFMTSFVYN